VDYGSLFELHQTSESISSMTFSHGPLGSYIYIYIYKPQHPALNHLGQIGKKNKNLRATLFFFHFKAIVLKT
jgi:hypothetical protein